MADIIEVWRKGETAPAFTFEPTEQTVVGCEIADKAFVVVSTVRAGYSGATRTWVFPYDSFDAALITELVK